MTIAATAIIPFKDRNDRKPLFSFVACWASARFAQVVVVEDSDSTAPFCKSRLMNQGAVKADNGILCFLDADTICDDIRLHEAFCVAKKRRSLVYPFQYIWRLTKEESLLLLEQNPETSQVHDIVNLRNPPSPRLTSPGSIFFIQKELYFSCGGMDESFFEWGAEDNEFRDRLRKLSQYEYRTTGWCYHLWHEPNPIRPEENQKRLALARKQFRFLR